MHSNAPFHDAARFFSSYAYLFTIGTFPMNSRARRVTSLNLGPILQNAGGRF